MALIPMDIQSLVVGGGPVASMVILKPRGKQAGSAKLPIRIGAVEAAAISMGVEGAAVDGRPMTHDLLRRTIEALGAQVARVEINDVDGTVFYARVCLAARDGSDVFLDARPSDALALAVRAHVPVFATSDVIERAALPDFAGVEKDEQAREEAAFHDFVENLSPEDFA